MTVLNLVLLFGFLHSESVDGLVYTRRNAVKMISERQIPAYMETMQFYEPKVWKETRYHSTTANFLAPTSSLDGASFGHLIAHSSEPLFTKEETDAVINECEARAQSIGGWTTSRHANYPTTDVPLVELPQTLDWFRNDALPSVIYPFLSQHYDFALPDTKHLRVVDAFVVKYNATAGQRELKPHRDGSVLSFNIALNHLDEYHNGGTWFDSLQTAVRSDRGHLLSHASGMLHGGAPITEGVRYILVAFVILRSYPDFAVRWYNFVRNS